MPEFLHQVVAIERGVVAETDKKIAEIRQVLVIGGDRNPLTGLSRTYQPRAEEGDDLPGESRKVQITVPELLRYAQEHLVKLFDVKLARETGNTLAKADVVIGEHTLLKGVPAAYLLFLETQLAQLIALIEKLPALDPAEDWHSGGALPDNVYASAPRQKERTQKTRQVQVLVPNQVIDGKPFPGRFEPYETDVIAGYWTLVKFSGELPVSEIQEMRARAVEVLEAVKRAREQANRLEVQRPKAGEAVLGYIFGQ